MNRRSASVLAVALAATTALSGLAGVAGAGPAGPRSAAQGAALVAGEPSARFAAFGDVGSTANSDAVLRTVAGLDPDLALVVGDLSYGTTGQEQAWCDFVTARVGEGFPFEIVAGNHESDGLNGNINDFTACLPNQLPGVRGVYGRQWYVDHPAAAPLVRFVTASPGLTFPDGNWTYGKGSARYQWVEAAIDGARAAGIPWVVVGIHKPCTSMGRYGCDIGQDLQDLLVAKKVDLVVHGHEHIYQRSHQLALSPDCPGIVPGTYDADCVRDRDGSFVRGAGTVLATVGTGGIAQREIFPTDPEAPYFAASSGLGTATWGPLDVQVTPTTLSAQFVRSSGGTFTDAFTITAPDPTQNQAPTASATVTCTGLECALDGSASSDPDGVISTWAWDLGDGRSASGRTATVTYAAAGTYTVRLTVTDDRGATATTTRTVTVAPVTGTTPFVRDTFGRTVSGGWGTAETGGAWRTSGSTANYSVSGGEGRVVLAAPGAGPDVSLPTVSSPTTDLTFTVVADKVPSGSGAYVYPSPRRITGVGEYRARVQLRADGRVTVGLTRIVGTTETAIGSTVVIPEWTFTAGERLAVRVQAAGSAPTVVRAKVWEAATPEPTTWRVSANDSTPELQASGGVRINMYLSGSATNAPVTLRYDDVVARTP